MEGTWRQSGGSKCVRAKGCCSGRQCHKCGVARPVIEAGTRVVKDFNGTTYSGELVSYSRSSGAWTVMYEDGTREELSRGAIQTLLERGSEAIRSLGLGWLLRRLWRPGFAAKQPRFICSDCVTPELKVKNRNRSAVADIFLPSNVTQR